MLITNFNSFTDTVYAINIYGLASFRNLMGKILMDSDKENIETENYDRSLAKCQICQYFFPSIKYAIQNSVKSL